MAHTIFHLLPSHGQDVTSFGRRLSNAVQVLAPAEVQVAARDGRRGPEDVVELAGTDHLERWPRFDNRRRPGLVEQKHLVPGCDRAGDQPTHLRHSLVVLLLPGLRVVARERALAPGRSPPPGKQNRTTGTLRNTQISQQLGKTTCVHSQEKGGALEQESGSQHHSERPDALRSQYLRISLQTNFVFARCLSVHVCLLDLGQEWQSFARRYHYTAWLLDRNGEHIGALNKQLRVNRDDDFVG
jgi:hypothetical protein